MLTYRKTLVCFAQPTAALLVFIAPSFQLAAAAQDASRLPETARLALRARNGDQIKMEGDGKTTTHIHLEAVSSDFSTESTGKSTSNYQYRGRGANGTLTFAAVASTIAKMTSDSGAPMKPTISKESRIYTVKPNMEVVRSTTLTNAKKSTPAPQVAGASELFVGNRLPDKPVKSGDKWSGTYPNSHSRELRGITLRYEATLTGFEMYQGLPCARVDTVYSYKGPLPGIEALVRKQLPAGSKLSSEGQLTGTETTFYSLDRGWPLNESAKMTLAITLSITTNGQTLEIGGTVDTDAHSAVTGYPTYDPSLVPKVAASFAP